MNPSAHQPRIVASRRRGHHRRVHATASNPVMAKAASYPDCLIKIATAQQPPDAIQGVRARACEKEGDGPVAMPRIVGAMSSTPSADGSAARSSPLAANPSIWGRPEATANSPAAHSPGRQSSVRVRPISAITTTKAAAQSVAIRRMASPWPPIPMTARYSSSSPWGRSTHAVRYKVAPRDHARAT